MAGYKRKVVVREVFDRFSSNVIDNMILSHLFYLTGSKWHRRDFVREEAQRIKGKRLNELPKSGWIVKTSRQLLEELLLQKSYSDRTIRRRLNYLVSQGVLFSKRVKRMPRVKAYRINYAKIRSELPKGALKELIKSYPYLQEVEAMCETDGFEKELKRAKKSTVLDKKPFMKADITQENASVYLGKIVMDVYNRILINHREAKRWSKYKNECAWSLLKDLLNEYNEACEKKHAKLKPIELIEGKYLTAEDIRFLFEGYFRYIDECDFLAGRDGDYRYGHPFSTSLAFFLEKRNYKRILEGVYHKKMYKYNETESKYEDIKDYFMYGYAKALVREHMVRHLDDAIDIPVMKGINSVYTQQQFASDVVNIFIHTKLPISNIASICANVYNRLKQKGELVYEKFIYDCYDAVFGRLKKEIPDEIKALADVQKTADRKKVVVSGDMSCLNVDVGNVDITEDFF